MRIYWSKKKLKTLLRIGLFLIPLFLIGGSIYAYTLFSNLPDPNRITERAVSQSTKLYDRTGKVLLYQIHGEEKRTVLKFNEIPDTVKWATISAEDDRFYHHIGIDVMGIVRAFLKDIIHANVSQGGSTITQQLVKNSLLTGERTVTRKIKEMFLAILIERKYSKDEILGLYLNQIPYGSNAYGIAAASETYFGKPAQELTLSESALLASLIKAPTFYSPYGSHQDDLMRRRDSVLSRMAELNYITKQQAEAAKAEKLVFAPPKQSIRAPHFVMYVREYLIERYGEDFVERGGLKVITSLDWNLQEQAEKIIREGAEKNEKSVGARNAALSAIDPKTGEILAMVGSRDYFDLKNDGNVNVTTRARQPGSSFKPFVYATAFKKGFTPDTVLFDVPTEFNPNCNPDGTPGPLVGNPKSCYHPKNYDGKFRGPVTLRQAIAQSLNIPSVKLLYLAGIEDSIKTAQDLGITTIKDPRRYGLTLVLGGAEVNLLEMTSAFGVFSQEGALHPKVAILRIENTQGEIVEEKKDATLPVLDTEVSREINSVLSDNNARIPVFSPQSSLYFPNRTVAVKTGTTQDYRDAWVVGYTPSLVAGVWVGNNDNTPMHQSGASVMVAGPLWHQFMDFALQNTPQEGFTPPHIPTPTKPILRGVYRSGPFVKIDKISGKLATSDTPPELIEERGFGKIQTILASIRRDDPLGDPPSDPPQDSQYYNWQAGIDSWLGVNSLTQEQPPTDSDDSHQPEKRPHILFLTPEESAQDVSEIKVEVQSTFPLKEVSLFLDDDLIESRTSPIVSTTFTFKLPEKLLVGQHVIKTTVYDAVGNKETLEKKINITP